jgi:hypothetical protein
LFYIVVTIDEPLQYSMESFLTCEGWPIPSLADIAVVDMGQAALVFPKYRRIV